MSTVRIKILLLLLAIFLFLGVEAYAASSGQRLWVRSFGKSNNKADIPKDIESGPRNTIFIAGRSGKKSLLAKYTSSGRLRWTRTFKRNRYAKATGRDVEIDRWGNAYIAGYSGRLSNRIIIEEEEEVELSGNPYVSGIGGQDDRRWFIAKYGRRGRKRWVRKPALKSPNGRGVLAVGDSGNVYFVGARRKRTVAMEFVVFKYNRRGRLKWARRIACRGVLDAEFYMDLDQAENVYLTIVRGSSYATVKYGRGGRRKWIRRYHNGPDELSSPQDLVVTANGEVYVTGSTIITTQVGSIAHAGKSDLEPRFGLSIVKYDQNGEQLWTVRHQGKRYDIFSHFSSNVDKQGNLFVVFWDFLSNTTIIKYGPDGERIWIKRTKRDLVPASSELDSKGNIVVAGYRMNAQWELNMQTTKYNTFGKRLWTRVEPGIESLGPALYPADRIVMKIDKKDAVYVTGKSRADDFDISTVKYAP